MIASRAAQPTRGMTVVAVIVCLIIITMISAAVLKVSLAQRELARSQERRLQAEWLAESGAQRAIARLAGDRGYTGETWSLTAQDLGLSERAPATREPAGTLETAARITIAVEALPATKNQRRIHVEADYPFDASRRSRHTKEITIDLEKSLSGANP